ncbi:MAG: hypothetical protein NVSMB49_03430 [Ktedonobacteraceae bacterium]
MTDDIPIYISPEDDVTSVRERLEKAPNRQVTMVIPAQTQLRSLVAWRVLHADARRMGKDVLVISTDPQIRSLAQAGKFRVAHSQASSITGKSRPSTRPGRSSGTARSKLTSSQARMPVARKPSVQFPPEITDENVGRVRPRENAPRNADALNSWYGPLPKDAPVLPNTEAPLQPTTTGNLKGKSTFSPSFDEPEPGQIYDLHVDPPPALHQVTPNLPQEGSTTYWADDADYKQAEDIRNSVQFNDRHLPPPVFPGMPKTPQETPTLDEQAQARDAAVQNNTYRTTPLPQSPVESVEPNAEFYPVMDEPFSPLSLSEQRGSAVINGLDTGEHFIHDDAIEEPVHEIDSGMHVEDLGEDSGTHLNTFDMPPIVVDTPHHSWSESLPLGQEQQESAGPSRIYKANSPRSSRRENRENVPPPSRRQDLDDPVDLPPIEERPTVIMPPEELAPVSPRSGTRPRNSLPLDVPRTPTANKKPAGKRASQQILSANPRSTTTARPKADIPIRAGTNAGVRRPNAGAPTKKLPEQSSRRSGAVLLLLAILLLLLIGLPAFFVPTADVTLKLPSKDYSHAVMLKAVSNDLKGSIANAVPSDQLTNDFVATGTGKATSSAQIGIAPATGFATFTNNGKVLVTIPSGIIITTSNGIVFSTQAEAALDVAGSTTASVLIPIQAQKPGTIGNVPAGSINSLPPDSLNAIVMANKMSASDLKLSVTNEQATASGGTGNTPAVSQQDIDAAKANLRTTVNKQFNDWLATKVGHGDQSGTLTTTETLENTPTVGQTTSDGTFTEKLKLSVVVLIVRAATLQHAAIAQLNRFVKQDKRLAEYTVVDDAKHPVQVQQVKKTTDGKTTLTLAFTAASKIVLGINVQHVQSLINGKSIKDARDLLLGLPGVRQVDVRTTPNIGNWTPTWIPFWSSHINVHLIPEDVVVPPKKK